MSQLIEGLLVEKRGVKTGLTKKGSKWFRTDFTVKDTEGEVLSCNTFGRFNQDFIGQHVQFNAEYNEKFNNYAVDGDISASGNGHSEEAEEVSETPATPKRRGRPAKAKAPATQGIADASDREAYRSDAEEAVTRNLKSAHAILKSLKIKEDAQALVLVADMVGRTQTAILLDKRRG